MSCKIQTTNNFDCATRRLSRKYRRLPQDLAVLDTMLPANPQVGDSIPGFADTVFKVRLASSDMKKGKSGGFRVIYHLNEGTQTVTLLDIYAKSEQENLDLARLQAALAELSAPAPETPPTSEEPPPDIPTQ
jgi:mRNA-degrading endonuclease RelE of RelBE toxin-antitoxin system